MEDTYHVEDMYHAEDLCREEEEESKEIYMKLSVTPAIKRDTLVAIAPSIPGIRNHEGTTGVNKVKDEKP